MPGAVVHCLSGLPQLWGHFRHPGPEPAGQQPGVLVILLLVKQFGVRRTRAPWRCLPLFPFILMMRLMSQQSDRIAALATQYPILQAQKQSLAPRQSHVWERVRSAAAVGSSH